MLLHPVRLSRFSVENYKAFEEIAEFELRPITLLYGFNSVGKSALLRALPMLSASADSHQISPIALNSPANRRASFADLISRGGLSAGIKFGFKWTGSDGETLSAVFSIRELPELRTQVVEKLSIDVNDKPVADFLWSPLEGSVRGGNVYKLKLEEEYFDVQLRFQGLVPYLDGEPEIPERMAVTLNSLKRCLLEFSSSVHWLSAVRIVPERYEPYIGARERIGHNGERAGQALANDVVEGGQLRALASRWYEDATDHELLLNEFALGSGEGFSLHLRGGRDKSRPINLVDTGEGMGQVLPVLTLCAMAAERRLGPSPLLCVEHPELHLQPATHGHLASYFARVVAAAPEVTLLVETHSETMLLQTQLQIASGKLDSKDVIVYWLGRGDRGEPTIERVTFDKLGRPVARNWPRDAFSSSIDIAKRIVEERKAQESVNKNPELNTHES